MGYLLRNRKRIAEAEPYPRDKRPDPRINGENHRDTLTYIVNLGVLLREQDKLGDAAVVRAIRRPCPRRRGRPSARPT